MARLKACASLSNHDPRPDGAAGGGGALMPPAAWGGEGEAMFRWCPSLSSLVLALREGYRVVAFYGRETWGSWLVRRDA